MNWKNNDDEDDSSCEHTPNDMSSTNPNTWHSPSDDTTDMWDAQSPDSPLYNVGVEPVPDPANDDAYVFPRTENEHPLDWSEMKQNIGSRANWFCNGCGTHTKNTDSVYGVLTTDPVSVDTINTSLFELRCSECTPDVARTTSTEISSPQFGSKNTTGMSDAAVSTMIRDLVTSTQSPSSTERDVSTDTTSDSYRFDVSDVNTYGFGTPAFIAKVAVLATMFLGLVSVSALVSGFTMAFIGNSPAVGVTAVRAVLGVAAQVVSFAVTPIVFTVIVSALYTLHLLHRDYWSSWRFQRHVPERRGARWLRLSLVAGVLSAVGFTGVASQTLGMNSLLSVFNVVPVTAVVAGAYLLVGWFAARELNELVLTDLERFEMDVRAWMYSASLRLGVFVAALSMSGFVGVSSRTLAAVAAVAPVTMFVYLTMRVASYRNQKPCEEHVSDDSDGSVQMVASMADYHRTPRTSVSTSTLSGVVRARFDLLRQNVALFAHRVRNNDRVDSYMVKHGKY